MLPSYINKVTLNRFKMSGLLDNLGVGSKSTTLTEKGPGIGGKDTTPDNGSGINDCVSLKGDFTSEEIIREKLLVVGEGLLKEFVPKLATQIQHEVENISKNWNTIKAEFSSRKEKIDVVGRNAHLLLKQMCESSGFPVFFLLCTNFFPLDKFKEEIRTANAKKQLEIDELLLETKTTIEDTTALSNILNAEHKILRFEKKIALEKQYQAIFLVKNQTANAASETADVISWENSSDFKEFEMKLKEDLEFLEYEHNKKYVAAMNNIQLEKNNKDEKEKRILQLKSALEKETLREQVIYAFYLGIEEIAIRFKIMIKDYPEIQKLLQHRIRLPNGTMEDDPYTRNSVYGMYLIMQKEFYKPNLTMFSHFLMKLVTYEADVNTSDNKPEEVVFHVEKSLSTWNELDLFKFMTKDHLFTIVLLRSFNAGSTIRQKIVGKTLEFIQDLEKKIGDSDAILSDGNDMYLYNQVIDYIREQIIRTDGFDKVAGSKVAKKNESSGNNSSSVPNAKKNFRQNKSNGTESAHSVTVTDNNKKFDKEVTREMNIQFQVGQQTFRYIALLKKCAHCENGTSEAHTKPKCWAGMCSKCKYYGHKANFCHQSTPLDRAYEAHQAEGASDPR